MYNLRGAWKRVNRHCRKLSKKQESEHRISKHVNNMFVGGGLTERQLTVMEDNRFSFKRPFEGGSDMKYYLLTMICSLPGSEDETPLSLIIQAIGDQDALNVTEYHHKMFLMSGIGVHSHHLYGLENRLINLENLRQIL